MARFVGVQKLSSEARNLVTSNINRVRRLNRQSAATLAVLISMPLLALGIVSANEGQPNTSQENNESVGQSSSISEVSGEGIENTDEVPSTKVEVSSSSQSSDAGVGAQVRIQGSVSTTNQEGVTETKTFDKTYNSSEGDATNSFSVNVTANTSSDAKVRIRSSSDSDVDIDLDDDSEVRIRD